MYVFDELLLEFIFYVSYMRKREHLVHILLIQPDFYMNIVFLNDFVQKIVRGGLWVKLLELQLQPKKKVKKNRKGNN